jgi:cobyrinic acid a,c-diamide synthase
VAKLTGLPVILVMDCSHLSQSAAAVALGYRSLDPDVHVVGIVLNHLKSAAHEAFVCEAMAAIGVEVVGVIPHGGLPMRGARHLGLLTAEEAPASTREWITALGSTIRTHLKLERIVALTEHIDADLDGAVEIPAVPGRPIIAYSRGPAASFIYPENLDLLREAGAETVGFDPRYDQIPAKAGLIWLHGGYPENYRDEIASNQTLLEALRNAVATQRPLVAECGGHLLLGDKLEGSQMAGILPFESTISPRLTLGYRNARAVASPSLLLPHDRALPAHEFHYATSTPQGDAIDMQTARAQWRAGYTNPYLLSSYLHWHLGADPGLAHALVLAASSTG